MPVDLQALQVFATVVAERSFSRAAEKLLRTQPAISLALKRLEDDIGAKLIDRSRSARDLVLTDVGRTVLEFARRFENLRQEMHDAVAELRDKSAGRLIIGANESSTHYLLSHIESYRRLYPKIKVQVRRGQSSRIPAEILDGNLELGVVSYDPADDRLVSTTIYNDALAFLVSPRHRLARRRSVTIADLGQETFIAHNVVSPYRDAVLQAFRQRRVPLNMDVEMPTLEAIRRLVESNEGVAFLPRMVVQQELERGVIREVTVKELHIERPIRLMYARGHTLSHAAQAFLSLVKGT